MCGIRGRSLRLGVGRDGGHDCFVGVVTTKTVKVVGIKVGVRLRSDSGTGWPLAYCRVT